MKLGEAIEFNQALQKDIAARGMTTFVEAIKLGIEALKVVKAVRPYSNSNHSYYLPGETE